VVPTIRLRAISKLHQRALHQMMTARLICYAATRSGISRWDFFGRFGGSCLRCRRGWDILEAFDGQYESFVVLVGLLATIVMERAQKNDKRIKGMET
jgi:hypothetical protein